MGISKLGHKREFVMISDELQLIIVIWLRNQGLVYLLQYLAGEWSKRKVFLKEC